MASRAAANWKQLEAALSTNGIAILYKYKSGTDHVEGVSFEKNGTVLKGSKIDRSMSFRALDSRLRNNAQRQVVIGHRMWVAGGPQPKLAEEQTPGHLMPHQPEEDLLKNLMDPVNQQEATNPALRKKQKRKKSIGLHL
ncbi:hypothetical protein [Dyadobacter sandarakinus]|uniref:Uncharacterized protein n=1 Tax=Dyadobacter sandarakinus TaxID=2747268 RepID=A0ABX7I7D7_9BACT|nr:hypothetical protein [Dyadobacter sandarakinus]QRR00891.1 hypothetical protein HWI92_08235 [Dyadobacter sandarakinus]